MYMRPSLAACRNPVGSWKVHCSGSTKNIATNGVAYRAEQITCHRTNSRWCGGLDCWLCTWQTVSSLSNLSVQNLPFLHSHLPGLALCRMSLCQEWFPAYRVMAACSVPAASIGMFLCYNVFDRTSTSESCLHRIMDLPTPLGAEATAIVKAKDENSRHLK